MADSEIAGDRIPRQARDLFEQGPKARSAGTGLYIAALPRQSRKLPFQAEGREIPPARSSRAEGINALGKGRREIDPQANAPEQRQGQGHAAESQDAIP